MPFLAGDKITAARLSFQQDTTTLTDDTLAASGVFEDWGTETVTFSDPGVEVSVTAYVTGNFNDSAAESTLGNVRVAISLDGGTVFTFGNQVTGRVGTNADQSHLPVAASHGVTGTPTGDIVIKAQFEGITSANVEVRSGLLTGVLLPT